MATWGFYGRRDQLEKLREILNRHRWFFVKITGRRRIGKTTLIQQAIQGNGHRNIFYVQIPDSGDAGILSQVNDALDSFHIPLEQYPRPRNTTELARLFENLAIDGYIVVIDEFQYFHRPALAGFCSMLQAVVDRLAAQAERVQGGWIVLGSIHTEMEALLNDRKAPLYHRVTDEFELPHWDISSLRMMHQQHTDLSPERFLFLWTLFEGVPKFYRDCFEQDVLRADRLTVIRRMFFESSSPLRSEADSWFLNEIGGKSDTVLKFVARKPGMMHKELVHAIEEASGETTKNIGSYLKLLTDRYQLIERKLPIFAQDKARQGRYYVNDNFLSAWLAALATRVSARTFRPIEQLVQESDEQLAIVEGIALEKLTGQIYQERSQLGIGDFPLTRKIDGYWDRKDTEIDLVAVNETDRRIRFGSCKRTIPKLLSDIGNLKNHAERFIKDHYEYHDWNLEYVGVSLRLDDEARTILRRNHIIPQSLEELLDEFPL